MSKHTYIKKNILLILYIILNYITPYAQSNEFDKLINSKKVNLQIQSTKIEKLLNTKLYTENDSLFYYYNQYAYWLYKNNQTIKALNFQKKAIENTKKNDSIQLQINYYYLGFFYYKNKEYQRSISVFNNSLSYSNSKKNIKTIYPYLGFNYKKIGNYKKSSLYFESLLNLLLLDNNLKKINHTYINLSNVYQYLNEKDKYLRGINYLLKADSISKKIKASKYTLYRINLNIGTLYSKNKNFNSKKALHYYLKALKIVKKEKNDLGTSLVYLWMGNLFRFENFEKSMFYLNKSLTLIPKNDKKRLNEVYTFIGETYAYNNDFENAIKFKLLSIEYLTGENFNNVNAKEIILKNSQHLRVLHLRFSELAKIYLKYYSTNKNADLLNKSTKYFNLADFVVNLLKDNSTEFKSKSFWRQFSTDIYGKAIKACFLNNDIEQAFYFMEKNKALLLMEDLATQTYRQTLDVPLASLEEENNLKQTILIAKNELESKITQTKIDSINKVLLDTKRELLTLQDSIYKGEKVTKKEPKILNIKEVQQNLKDNEVFVEYHVSIDDGYGIYTNRENGYVVILTKNKKYFFEINHLSILKEEVTTLINALKSPFKTNEDFSTYNALAHTVYKKLFPTQEVRDLLKNKKVRIAPDSYLSLLPFETLITQINENDKFNQPNYLIREANISYVYSYSFLKHNTFRKNDNKEFLGFAPTSFNYDNISEINNSKSEILNLKNYYNGDHFINEKATKKSFLENIENYNIIHLATHANAQDSINPWIAFKNEKLNLEELYLAKNNASLVVLSGCNTTLGKQEIGEGIMSLARGFFYGGSQSVVSSLWNVDDKATPYIMNEFYKNLSHGKTKSEALHLAKLNYLDNHSLSEASPHFWASFILLGQDNVVETDRNYSIWWIACLVIVILGLLFYVWKKKQTTLMHGK